MTVDRRAAAWSAIAAVPFVLLLLLVVGGWQPLLRADDAVGSWLHAAALQQPWLFDAMRVLAVLAGPGVLRVAMLLVAGLLLRRGMPRLATWVALGTALELFVVTLFKHTVQRPRPRWGDAVYQTDGWSFPSGHASAGALLAIVVAVLVLTFLRRSALRGALLVVVSGFALLLGVDRVLLGVHHPSDVLGSYLLVPVLLAGAAALLGGTGSRQRRLTVTGAASTATRKSRLAVVLNPIKVADARGFRRLVNDAAERSGWDTPLWFETSVDDAGRAMTHAALTAGADVVIAAGGDGTVRVVASELARTGVALGIVPAGTGNLLARNLALPLQVDPALEVILTGRDRAIDLVRIEGDGLEPDHFAVMGGLGLDAAIMGGAPDQLKKRVGWPAYVIAGLRHFRDPAVRVEITVDDTPMQRYRARTVVVGNVGTLTGGIPLLPDAAPDDGLLDVVVLAPRRLLTWVRVVARVLSRRRHTDERLDRRTGRRVVIRAEHPTARQMDGDVFGEGSELVATVEPGVLLVRVPR